MLWQLLSLSFKSRSRYLVGAPHPPTHKQWMWESNIYHCSQQSVIHTFDDALECYVKQPVLCLSIWWLNSSCFRSEEDIDSCVIAGQWTHIVVSNTSVHASTFSSHIVQSEFIALQVTSHTRYTVNSLLQFSNSRKIFDVRSSDI